MSGEAPASRPDRDATTATREWNFDGLVGPTHNYAGLAPGNLASSRSAGRRAHPRAAALQGLEKMALLHRLGVPQAVLPPQPRPDLTWLRRLGFDGPDARVIERAAREAPRLLSAAWSASSMWAANAATVVPSADSGDGRVHLVPANLSSERHRSLEPPWTSRILRAVFSDPDRFAHHAPLPIAGDEGAANHVRLCRRYGEPGVELFVYGRDEEGSTRADASGRALPGPRRHPARQSEAASRAIARLAGLEPDATVFCRQHPDAIDAGVFHNDVIATGDRNLLLLHAGAFVDQVRVLDALRERYASRCGGTLRVIQIEDDALPLARAVDSYLFNCQIVATDDDRTAWIGPLECREDPATAAVLERLGPPHGPFDALHTIDLRESMRNGGGPACLRLRVPLEPVEAAGVHPGVRFDERLHARLVALVERHYRQHVDPEDLADPGFAEEAQHVLAAILEALELPDLYAPDAKRAEPRDANEV